MAPGNKAIPTMGEGASATRNTLLGQNSKQGAHRQNEKKADKKYYLPDVLPKFCG